MKNYSLMFFAILVCLCATNQHVMAQATGNNVPLFGKYLGFNGAQNLELRTNNIIRMQLTQTNTSTINGFTVNNSGFLGLSAPLAATLLSQKLTSADASIPSAL